MGHHEKAPIRCPCSRLAALDGAPRTLLLLLQSDDGHQRLYERETAMWDRISARFSQRLFS